MTAAASGDRSDVRLSRRDLLVGGALVSTAALSGFASWPLRPNQLGHGRHSLDAIVPERVGAWRKSQTGGVLIPTADLPENAGYDDVLTRHYADGRGGMIMFLVAYGTAQAGRAQLHRPEACYPAAGFSLFGSRQITLAELGGRAVAGRTMTATKPGRIEQILYWSRIGTEFPTSSTAQSYSTIRQSLGGSLPDGALVRLSTINADRGTALRMLRGFADSLLAHPAASLQKLLTGTA